MVHATFYKQLCSLKVYFRGYYVQSLSNYYSPCRNSCSLNVFEKKYCSFKFVRMRVDHVLVQKEEDTAISEDHTHTKDVRDTGYKV